EIDLLKKILKPGMIFVDIGANIGYFSLVSAKLVGDQGQVYAFEPDPDNFNLLEKNIKANNYKNIIAVNKAVSNKSGKARLYLEPDNLCAHSLVAKNDNKFVEVETVILDEFLKDKKIDVIKIDVEGFEPVVLEGMKNIIKNNDKISIITEFYPEAIKKAGYSPEKYKNDLKDLGFKLNEFGEGKKLINIFAQKS
ncbi:FkbM family methyltransferase, partial [Patescibacteria group bacterium]|nr:FkbM family methyltransferase [Patescibacteria group bacterium]